jgi:hypothetical protein
MLPFNDELIKVVTQEVVIIMNFLIYTFSTFNEMFKEKT